MNVQALYDFVAEKANKCTILVVGDVMLDKYYYGEVNRISPEAPVPISHVKSEMETLGGAANVAHNLARLGCETSIAGYIGDDYHGQSLISKFTELGIDYKGLVTTGRTTTAKLRIIGEHQQMLRLDFEESEPIEAHYATRLQNYIERRLSENLDAVILSDYGKGACTETACQMIIQACQHYGVPVIIDPKGTNWTKYANADYITPNLKEINEVLIDKIKNEDKLIEKAAHYAMCKYNLKQVMVTRSAKGLSLVTSTEATHIPTRAQDVYDVSGAGDTVIAVFAMALAGGLKPTDSAALANLAASVVVAKLGTYAVSREELMEVLKIAQKDRGLL